jgi:hypothetical protein
MTPGPYSSVDEIWGSGHTDCDRCTNRRAADEAFARAWEDALEQGTDSLEDEARRRALQGVEKPVFREGRQVGTVTEYSDTLLIFLLKARRPEKFRDRARFEALNKKSAGGAGRPAASSVRFRFRRAIPGLALPLRDYLEASHSHERHTVHGLHEHKSHEQDVPCGDGNKGCRLCSSGQSFQPIDKPARYRQNL